MPSIQTTRMDLYTWSETAGCISWIQQIKSLELTPEEDSWLDLSIQHKVLASHWKFASLWKFTSPLISRDTTDPQVTIQWFPLLDWEIQPAVSLQVYTSRKTAGWISQSSTLSHWILHLNIPIQQNKSLNTTPQGKQVAEFLNPAN